MSAHNSFMNGFGRSIGLAFASRLMPLGRPVVPDEYSMSEPAISSTIGVVGCAAMASSHDRNPGRGSSTT